MKFLIQAAKIIQKGSAFHQKKKDILIENGKITKIGTGIKDKDAQLIAAEGLMISAGWMDTFSVIREPGNEHQDRLSSLCSSAAFGGFTEVIGISGSQPSLSDRSSIEYVKNQTKTNSVNVLLAGTVTEKNAGENIAELYDMYLAGAVGFSEGIKHIQNPELLKIALQYTKSFNSKVMVYSEDADLAAGGMVNEGSTAAGLGMKVRPVLAEEVALERNIKLATYAEVPIYLQGISSEAAVQIVAAAKKKKLPVKAEVHLSSLLFDDSVLEDFDTTYKVLPVIRTKKDQKSLLQALKNGVIDTVASGHTPQDIENKACEFDHAGFGMMTLECALPAFYKKFKNDFSLEDVIELFTIRPRAAFGLPKVSIAEGEVANLTLFTEQHWTFEKAMIKSTSKNSPFIGQSFSIKVLGIFNKEQLQLNA